MPHKTCTCPHKRGTPCLVLSVHRYPKPLSKELPKTRVILATSLGLVARRDGGQGFRAIWFTVIGRELTGLRRFRFLKLQELKAWLDCQ